MNEIIILCNSLDSVARKILKCDISSSNVLCFQTDTSPTYLVITNSASVDLTSAIKSGEKFTAHERCVHDKYPICYSIKISDLEREKQKYKKLAELIFELKYQFTQAKVITDSYGEEYLVLFN